MSGLDAPKSCLIVDFGAGGHHPKHLRHVVRYGLRADSGAGTRLLVSRELAARTERELSTEERAVLRERAGIIEDQPAYMWLLKWVRIRALVERLFVEYLIATKPPDCELILLYLDPFLPQLACLPFRRKLVSGLLFRTSFHYRQTGFRLDGVREYGLFLAKYLLCYLCARRRGLHRILVLDPFAQSYAQEKWRTAKFITIPDPIGPEPEAPASYFAPRKRDADSRRVMLLCGELSRRKGVLVVLRALTALEPENLSQVRLRLVGTVHAPERSLLERELESLRRRQPSTEITLDDRFVSDEELDGHMAEADVVLTLYERTFGSSGTVIRAAAFGRPVIATDQGLVGYLVRTHHLGDVVDVRDINAVTEAFRRFIRTGVVSEFQADAARAYANSCAPPVFARHLLAFETAQIGLTAVQDEKTIP